MFGSACEPGFTQQILNFAKIAGVHHILSDFWILHNGLSPLHRLVTLRLRKPTLDMMGRDRIDGMSDREALPVDLRVLLSPLCGGKPQFAGTTFLDWSVSA